MTWFNSLSSFSFLPGFLRTAPHAATTPSLIDASQQSRSSHPFGRSTPESRAHTDHVDHTERPVSPTTVAAHALRDALDPPLDVHDQFLAVFGGPGEVPADADAALAILRRPNVLRISEAYADITGTPLPPELYARLPDAARREAVACLDRAAADALRARGLLFSEINDSLATAIAKLLRVRRDGVLAKDDPLVTFTPMGNTPATQLVDRDVWDDVKDALENATTFFYLINFQFELAQGKIVGDTLFALLKRKAQEGVEIVVVCDQAGLDEIAPQPGHAQRLRELQAAGVTVVINNPFAFWRTGTAVEHRKIWVGDHADHDVVAYVGSTCMSSDWIASGDASRRYAEHVQTLRASSMPASLDAHLGFELDPDDTPHVHDHAIRLHGDGARAILAITMLSLIHHGVMPQPPSRRQGDADAIPLEDGAFLRRYFGERWLSGAEVHDVHPDERFCPEMSVPFVYNGLRRSVHDFLDRSLAAPTTTRVDCGLTYVMFRSVVDKLRQLAQGDPATGRQTQVRFMVPGSSARGHSDSPMAYHTLRMFYPDVVAANVALHEFEGFTHLKVMVRNGGEDMLVMTGNVEPWSFGTNTWDITLRFTHAQHSLGQQMTAMFDWDCTPERSTRVTPAHWQRTSWREYFLQGRALRDAYGTAVGKAVGLVPL